MHASTNIFACLFKEYEGILSYHEVYFIIIGSYQEL